MTYREHSAHLAQHLAAMTTASGSRYLDEPGLNVALTGRHETIRLMQEAMAVATGRTPAGQETATRSVQGTTLRQVMADPVQALQRTVDAYPLVRTDLALMDVRTEHLTSATASLWHQVARAATIARHHLTGENPAYTGEHRWSLVADVAALAPVVQDLDHHLHAAARRIHPDDSPAVRALAEAHNSPATLLSAEVSAIARTARLPDLTGLRTPPLDARPVQVTSPATLLQAQRRLPLQLRRAEEIRPDVITGTALGQARILLAAGDLLTAHRHTCGADLARDIAEHLGRQIHPDPKDITSLLPGDSTPLVQTRLMWQYLRQHRVEPRPLQGTDVMALRGVVHHAPTVIEELSRTANAQLTSGRWLISYAESTRYDWDRYHYYDDDPRLVTALRDLRTAYPAKDLSLAPRAQLDSARTTLPRTTSRQTRLTRPDSPDLPVLEEGKKAGRSRARAPGH